MLYIITYTNFESKYFKRLMESFPNIIVLGYDSNENNKLIDIVDFCKEKPADDIILFLHPMQSIILHTEEIVEKFLTYKKPLVFSQNPIGRCYMGRCDAVINFWKDVKIENEEKHINEKCNEVNSLLLSIDTNNKIFYNFKTKDIMNVTGSKIKIGEEYPNILISSINGDIDNILISLKTFNKEKVIEFAKSIKFEIIYLIILIFLIVYLQGKYPSLNAGIRLLYEFINYHVNIKNLAIPDFNKHLHILISLLNTIAKFKLVPIINRHIPSFLNKFPSMNKYDANAIKQSLCGICIRETIWKIFSEVLVFSVFLISKYIVLGKYKIISKLDNTISLLLSIIF